ncbi:MAG: discoidin domain-containing protein [Sedimentisphaerales bacterium]|nr:discoidin domain-containing protein [Sedimentisphaerales bacterium]
MNNRAYGITNLLTSAVIAIIFFVPISGEPVQAAAASDIEAGFISPPDSAKPRVWWHWTGGNVTKEGITKDLEWMKRVGIGGAQAADIGMGGGQTIENPISFFTPEWFDAIKHAASESDRLGLEMGIFSSSGWSLTGGPWVKPEQAMKKLVWSTTEIQGPTNFTDKLQQPPSGSGMLSSLRGTPAPAAPAGRGMGRGGPGGNEPPFYRDSAVIAFRTPSDETLMQELNPTVTSSGGQINAAALMDDSFSTGVRISAGADGAAWVQYEFSQPITARAVTLIGSGSVPFGSIEVSDDGTNFRPIAGIPGAVQYRPGGLKTYAFPETTARFFRVSFTGNGPSSSTSIPQSKPVKGNSYSINEFIVHTGARVDRWEDKAGMNLFFQYDIAATPPVPNESAIKPTEVIDLTSKLDKDGNLNWDVPQGKWTILRIGYALTGAQVRAGTAGGAGPEVDKLNAKHVEAYFHGYVDPIKERLGGLLGKSLLSMVMDSFEAGMQNWTDDMIEQFTKRRGYNPLPYLPVLTGRVVGSADISDRFLWDFRRTIVDLLAEAHYGTMSRLLNQYGMILYSEAPGVSMEIVEDTLLTKGLVDIPMGEFWLGRMHPAPEYYVDVRMAASAAHIYGKQFVATESFTGGGYDSPVIYKNLADYWFAQGVNRMVFHSSSHQPLDTKPGNTMVGTHFNRNITWAEQSKAFLDYMSRVQFMLSQGLFVADFAYLLNEGAPSSQPFWGAGLQPQPPEGYDYDTINADVLLNRVSVSDDGRMVLPDGMSYRILVLPQIDRIRPELLKKIRELVLGGVTLIGPKPRLSPSLQGGQQEADLQVQSLANEIWGDLDGEQRNRHYFGKGLVTWGLPPEQVLGLVTPQMVNPITGDLFDPSLRSAVYIPKDAEFAGPLDSDIVWIHRRTNDADYYFVANRTDRPMDVQARFRVAGKEAELWYPDTGKIEPAEFNISNNLTAVPMHLSERQSVFVVFRKPTSDVSRKLPEKIKTIIAAIDGTWDISFPPNLGAPEKIQLAKLQSWTEHSDSGVKYFSGTAAYTKTIQVQQSWLVPQAKIILELGTVKDIAEVSVNGKQIGTLWTPPFKLDITDTLKQGENKLEIKVTNQWTNRITGDGIVPQEERVLNRGGGSRRGGLGGFGGGFGGRGGSSLAESGLIGPVTIVSVTNKP